MANPWESFSDWMERAGHHKDILDLEQDAELDEILGCLSWHEGEYDLCREGRENLVNRG